MMNSQDIGQMIRRYRKKSGLSQKELALLAGVGKTVVFDIEKGKSTIQLNSLLNVLAILNIQIKFIKPIPEDKL